MIWPYLLRVYRIAAYGYSSVEMADLNAASILAKVARDDEMIELDARYPQYGFAGHKGYPTKAHFAALEQYGAIDEHRKSFKPVQRVLALSGKE